MCQLNSSEIINIQIDMYIKTERIAGLALALTTIQKKKKIARVAIVNCMGQNYRLFFNAKIH